MKKVLFFIMVALLYSCCRKDDCPGPVGTLRFLLVDEQTNHNLVFGEHAIYDINEIKIYSSWSPMYEGETDTIFYYGVGSGEAEGETYISTTIDGVPNKMYLKLNKKEIDTLTYAFSVNSKDCGCEYYQLDMVKHNDRIICNECRHSEINTIYK